MKKIEIRPAKDTITVRLSERNKHLHIDLQKAAIKREMSTNKLLEKLIINFLKTEV